MRSGTRNLLEPTRSAILTRFLEAKINSRFAIGTFDLCDRGGISLNRRLRWIG
jgi:hypothetical protein